MDKYGANRPLAGGYAHVSTFVATVESGSRRTPGGAAFLLRGGIEGHSVSLLTGIAREVYRALVECEAGQPLSPLARDPLP